MIRVSDWEGKVHFLQAWDCDYGDFGGGGGCGCGFCVAEILVAGWVSRDSLACMVIYTHFISQVGGSIRYTPLDHRYILYQRLNPSSFHIASFVEDS